MLEFFAKGGPVLWIIMALAFVGLSIIIERLLYFRRIDVDEEKLFSRVKSALEKGRFDEAMAICDTNVSPLSALMKVGIEHRSRSEQAQKEVLKDAANQEVPRLEKGVSALGTIAHIAPLLGLLGTVTGTMKAFGVLGRFGAVTDPAVLALGVSEALVTTVGGIVVAVPAVIFYNFLVTKVNLILVKMENQVNTLILMVNAGNNPKRRAEDRDETLGGSFVDRASGFRKAPSREGERP
ncbi:MAG: MotA/TolQ/ExbB proton channel family protein [Spirochaetia bacterium]|nr:MotA/TolQ/ExbB proton channel family protein [Spirochaetia bacterium]